jgi:SCO1/SenC
MRRNLFIVILAGFFLGALAALLLFVSEPSGPGVETSGTALIGGPFALTDPSGKTVTDRDFHDRYKLVFFGFTHCPDICPAEAELPFKCYASIDVFYRPFQKTNLIAVSQSLEGEDAPRSEESARERGSAEGESASLSP